MTDTPHPTVDPVTIAARGHLDALPIKGLELDDVDIARMSAAFAALEAAGFRIVGPEPTPAMADKGNGLPDGIDDVWLTPTRPSVGSIWRAMHAAAPLYGKEEERG